MRKLPPTRAQIRPLSTRQHRAWLATWLQDRRRGRIAPTEPEPEVSPLLVNLVGYFNLDEAGDWDDAIDATGIMGDLVANGSIPAHAGPGAHGARDFGAGGIYSGSQLEQAGFNALTAVPVTINLWHYQVFDGGQIPLQASGDGAQGMYLFVATDGGWLDAGLIGAGGNQNTGMVFGSWGVEAWNMFTIVFDATNWQVYVNGVEIGTGAHSATSFAASNTLFQLSGLPWTCDAYLSLVGLWNRALSAVEVDQLYNFGDGLAYGEL